MKILILVSLAIILLSLPKHLFSTAGGLNSEAKIPKKLQLNAGYYNMGSVDEIYSYNLYSGSDICYGLRYSYGKNSLRKQLSFRFSMIERSPGTLTLTDKIVAVDARERVLNSFLFEAFDTYRFPIELKGADFLRFWVTGTWMTTVNISSNSYGIPELIQSGLAPGAFLETTFPKHNIHGQLWMPIISWTVRNNYSQSMTQNYESLSKFAFVLQNSQLQFPNTLLAVFSEIGYDFAVSKRLNLGCDYNFRYMNNSSPRKLESISGIYSFGLTYKFGKP
jgi:hypothetical protein